MALKNEYQFTFPSYDEILDDSIKDAVKIGDVKTVYSLLFFYLWTKTDEPTQVFCDSNLTYLMNDLDELITDTAIPDSIEVEDCGSFFKRLEMKRNQDIDDILFYIDSDLLCMINVCTDWMENTFDEMKDYTSSFYKPLHHYIDLLKIARCGIQALLSGEWNLQFIHSSMLIATDFKNDLNFEEILF